MAKARVELRGCMTHSGRGRTFRKGVPQIMTNPSDILYYQSQGDFSVVMLDDDPAPKAEEPKPKTKVKVPEPVDEDEPEGDEDEDEGGEPEGEDETKPSMESAVIAAEERKKPVGGKPGQKQKVKATK